MFKRRLSRLRTASFVIFTVSIVYFLEAFLRYFLIASNSEIQYALHKNSRILLARLTRTRQKLEDSSKFGTFDSKYSNSKFSSSHLQACQITVVDIENGD